MRLTTAAESAEIASAAFAIPYSEGGGGAFMAGHLITKLVARTRLAQRWPELTVAMIDDDGRCVARGVSVPFCSLIKGRPEFPDGGWEQVVVWAAEDALDDHEPDTVCALEIAVHPELQGRGLSGQVLEAMVTNAGELGFSRMIAPVRPPQKTSEPRVPMADYLTRVRADGLPADPWLRVHVRAGGTIRSVARCSATIAARLDQWRRWTGLPLTTDGLIDIEGGLVPLLVSTELDVGCYVEPNVWVEHPLDP